MLSLLGKLCLFSDDMIVKKKEGSEFWEIEKKKCRQVTVF